VVVVLAVGVVTWIAVSGGGDDGSTKTASRVEPVDVPNGGPQVGDHAPDFTATTLDGKTVSLSDYAGKPVVLNFWASWCNPCREEFPLFRKQLAAHGDEYVMLGVDSRDIASDARAFAREEHATWPIAVDSSNAIYKAYGIPNVPQTFFIRPDGTVAQRYYSSITNPAEFATGLAKIVTTPSS
jgi:peroxiredoxin